MYEPNSKNIGLLRNLEGEQKQQLELFLHSKRGEKERKK